MRISTLALISAFCLIAFVFNRPSFAEKPVAVTLVSKPNIFNGARVTKPMKNLLLNAQRLGWKGGLNGPLSGVRTYRQQKILYQRFLDGGPAAFVPGGDSRHEIDNVEALGPWSMAIDVSRPKELIYIAKKLGVTLSAPYPDEPWHLEASAPF